jgi:hypothetical protein
VTNRPVGLPRWAWSVAVIVLLSWVGVVENATRHTGEVIGTTCRYPDPSHSLCGPLRGRDDVLFSAGQAGALLVLVVLGLADRVIADRRVDSH